MDHIALSGRDADVNEDMLGKSSYVVDLSLARCSTFAAAKLEEHFQRACPKDDAALKKLIFDIDAAFLSTGKPSGSTCTMRLGTENWLYGSR